MEKMDRADFEKQYAVLIDKKETLSPGTNKVLFNQRQALLKHLSSGEIIPTGVYASTDEYAEFLVFERFCNP